MFTFGIVFVFVVFLSLDNVNIDDEEKAIYENGCTCREFIALRHASHAKIAIGGLLSRL